MATPTGPIKAVSGLDWKDITQYDAFIHEAADKVGWPIERVRGHIVIESRGDPRAHQVNRSNGDSYGLLQVVPFGVGWAGWFKTVITIAGLPDPTEMHRVINALYDPRINIAVGVAILESFYLQHGTLDRASSAFFTGTPNWGGNDTVNGTTGRQYRDTLNALIREQEAFKPQDPLAVIYPTMNPAPRIHFGFRERNTAALYAYGVGHGTNSAYEHSGIDISVPYETPIHAPAAGRVLCVGGRGSNVWGQGCGSFDDTGDAGPGSRILGVGNITILFDSGLKWTVGHSRKAFVAPGDRVVAGQRVGTSGGMFGPHSHIDMVEQRNGTYWLLDPIPALMRALGGQVVIPDPEPVYADRLPTPQPGEFPNWWRVEALTDGVRVLQHTGEGAPEVHAPLKQGEEFDAVNITIGQDGLPWWITKTDESEYGSRVRLQDTKVIFGTQFIEPMLALLARSGASVGSADTAKVLDALYALKPALEATVRVVDETVTELEEVA